MKGIKFCFHYTRNINRFVIAGAILQVLSAVFCVLVPTVGSMIITKYYDKVFPQILGMACLYFLLRLLTAAAGFLLDRIDVKIYAEIIHGVSKDVLDSVFHVSQSDIDRRGSGIYGRRLTEDTEEMAQGFIKITNGISECLYYVGNTIAILVICPAAFLCVIPMYICVVILESLRRKAVRKNEQEFKTAKDSVHRLGAELIAGSADIRALDLEKEIMKNALGRIWKGTASKKALTKTSSAYTFSEKLVIIVFNFVYILVVAWLVCKDRLSAAYGIVLFNYGINLGLPVLYIINNAITELSVFNVSAERLNSLINGQGYEKEHFGTVHLERAEGRIDFEHVSFSYMKRNEPGFRKNIDDISFHIDPCEVAAIAGKNGVGKTTLFNLLSGLYSNYTGSIRLDGIELKDLDRESLKKNISLVSQHPYFFSGTIRDNLTMAVPGITEERMMDACRDAGIHDTIVKKANGYDTMLGEGGSGMSGGQLMRLAVARAFLRDTPVILMDEAGAHLDENREAIMDAFTKYRGKKTILYISHMAENIELADRILYFVSKNSVVCGTYESLKECCPEFEAFCKN